MKREVHIVDTTLRDGEQMPGLAFSSRQKARLAKCMADAGITEIEALTPAMGCVEQEAFWQICEALGEKLKEVNLYSWNRLRFEDIDTSLQWGIKNLFISAPVSQRQFIHMLKLSRDELAERFEKYVSLAVCEKAEVVCGFMDIKNAGFDFIVELAHRVASAGAKRIRLSDTNGTMTPMETYRLFSDLREEVSLPLEFHAHNDFGLAGANSLAAAEAGAEYVDTTTLGIGERAGNASTEEVVVALERLLEMETGVDMKKITALARKFAAEHGFTIASNRPVLGDKIFHHESGIHVAGIEKHPEFFEPWSPEVTGNERKIVLGKHTGLRALLFFCRLHGLPLDKELEQEALTEIRKFAGQSGASLHEPEAIRILRRFCFQKKMRHLMHDENIKEVEYAMGRS